MTETTEETALRRAIIDACLEMNAMGLNQGTSGNISVRYGQTMLISPSAIKYDRMQPDMIATLPIEGEYGTWDGPLKPSTEWRFHLDILRKRPEVGAIVHLHSPFATILAILREPIPACHYMIAAFGGDDIRCSGYACYGTKALSDEALLALKDRNGCLLANHGMIAVGPTLDKAIWMAIELETIAKQYYHAKLLGEPVILTERDLEETRINFATYGLQE